MLKSAWWEPEVVDIESVLEKLAAIEVEDG